MAPEISVERQYHFHCSCGATTLSGERKVTCSGCGDILGIRRIRRRRQPRDFVAYYGSSVPVRRIGSLRREPNTGAGTSVAPAGLGWTNTVQRVERRIQDPNEEARLPRSWVRSRLGTFLKRALASCGDFLRTGVGKKLPPTGTALNLDQWLPHDTAGRPVGRPSRGVFLDRPLVEGSRVKVGRTRPGGNPHPHAGKTGAIRRFIDTYSEPYWLGLPSAMIELDSPTWPREFIWVSLKCLEPLPGDRRTAD